MRLSTPSRNIEMLPGSNETGKLHNNYVSSWTVSYTYGYIFLAYFIPPPSYDICIQQTPNDMITNTDREADTDTDTEDVPWSSSLYKASLCSMLCCSLFGVIATTMSVMAYVDHMVSQDTTLPHQQSNIACLIIKSLDI